MIDRGERAQFDRVPDSEPDGRVERTVARVESSALRSTCAVHRPAAPRDYGSAAGQLLHFEATSGARSRWHHVATVRDQTRRSATPSIRSRSRMRQLHVRICAGGGPQGPSLPRRVYNRGSNPILRGPGSVRCGRLGTLADRARTLLADAHRRWRQSSAPRRWESHPVASRLVRYRRSVPLQLAVEK